MMKDLIGKLTNLEETAPKPKQMLTEDAVSPAKTRTFKDVFSEMSESIAPGTKPLPIMDPANKKAGIGVLSSPNPGIQNMLKSLDPKDVQVVMTQQQPATTTPAAGQTPTQQAAQNTQQSAGITSTTQGGTGQAMGAGTEAVQEKDEGKPGKNFAKIAKSAGKRYGSKEAGERVAGAIRAKLAKQGKLEEEQVDEISNTAKANYAHKAANQMADRRVTDKWDDEKFMRRSKALGKVQNQLRIGQSGGVDPNDKIEYMREGAKVDRMVKHIEKSERGLGKSKEKASDIAWATANKRGMLDNKNKKKTNESSDTVEYRVLGQYDAKTSKGYDTRPVSVKVKAAGEKEAKELAKQKLASTHKNYRPTKVETLAANVKEADIPSSQGIDTRGAGLGAGRSPTTLEGKTMSKKAKPDFLDMDKDGNKKEPMKKAIKDKKTVKEGLSSRIAAARSEGRADGLRERQNRVKHYEDIEEARAYHEGYKDGLDECYGQGVYEAAPATPAATVGGMASGALTDEGNAFTKGLATTPRGGKFSVGGKSFTDRTGYDAKLGEGDFAFESWSNQLNELLNEGLSVSVSKGNENAPDSVNINATDAEADQLLALVKSAGLGLFGDEAGPEAHPSSAMSIQPASGEPDEIGAGGAEIDVVDDSDGMLSLMKKLGGVEAAGPSEEEGEEEHTCNECGMMESQCGCSHGKDKVEEVESEDQQEFEVSENAPDSGAEDSVADEDAEAKEDADLAGADSEDEEEMNEGFTFESIYKKFAMISESADDEEDVTEGEEVDSDDEEVTEEAEEEDDEEDLTEWANNAGKKGTDAQFTQDIDFMTKVIAGGLNKPKSTGQTTVPVIAGQENRMHDNPMDWATLAGIKK